MCASRMLVANGDVMVRAVGVARTWDLGDGKCSAYCLCCKGVGIEEMGRRLSIVSGAMGVGDHGVKGGFGVDLTYVQWWRLARVEIMTVSRGYVRTEV